MNTLEKTFWCLATCGLLILAYASPIALAFTLAGGCFAMAIVQTLKGE